MTQEEIAEALQEFATEVVDSAPASATVEIATAIPGFPQTSGEHATPVDTPTWIAQYRIVTAPHADVRPESAATVREKAAAHLREQIEHDPTLGERVTMREAIRSEFAEERGVVRVAATIDAP